MLVLGIESSCDETAAALVNSNKEILANVVSSQLKHKDYGGVVPEVAARAHLNVMPYILQQALREAKVTLKDVTAIAATVGPGLYGSLLVGATTAKSLAFALNKPFIAINHLEAHILTPRLFQNIPFPYLALLISGGHSQFISIEGIQNYKILGTTLDDALGEAFDKTARLLGFPYPGGKNLEELAKTGTAGQFYFKPPLLHAKNCNFSFSGLKTAVSQKISELELLGKLTIENKANIAKAFETAILASLKAKTSIAIKKFKLEKESFNHFIVSGGVAANKSIRLMLQALVEENKGSFYAPPIALCGDNAAMVAWAGVEKLKLGITSPLNTKTKPNLSLEEII